MNPLTAVVTICGLSAVGAVVGVTLVLLVAERQRKRRERCDAGR